jgi:hypothetical protein
VRRAVRENRFALVIFGGELAMQGLLANVQCMVGRFNCEIYEHRSMLIIWLLFVACTFAQSCRLHINRSGRHTEGKGKRVMKIPGILVPFSVFFGYFCII